MNESLVYNWRVINRVIDSFKDTQRFLLLIHFRLPIVFTNVFDTNSYQLILTVVFSCVI